MLHPDTHRTHNGTRKSSARRRNVFIHLICLFFVATLSVACSDKATDPPVQQLAVNALAKRPNIVFLLLDDAGYSDMSAFGGEIQTPTIERLVREGVTVKRFYTAARCSPTRAGILSGHYPHDVGMADLGNGPKFKTAFAAYQGQLPSAIPLVSELLQAAGYTTYMQGKWHLGTVGDSAPGRESLPAPNQRGFDEFFGFLGGMAGPYPDPFWHPYLHNDESMAVEKGWYSVAGLNEEMMKALSAQLQDTPEKPFFIYFAAQSPHVPLQAPEALVKKYLETYKRPLEELWQSRVSRMRTLGLLPKSAPVKMPQFSNQLARQIHSEAALRAAMLESTDAELGKLLQLLEKSGELDNTIIIVASDNGASAESAQLTNAPFRGAKALLHEGGTLSPLVARWPDGNVKANTTTDAMTTYLDIMPTFLQVAGVSYPSEWRGETLQRPLMGRDLLPLLQGDALPPPDTFFWNLYGSFAVVHEGRWKLLGNAQYEEKRDREQAPPTLELYDLLSDPAETNDLSASKPRMAASLLSDYEVWAKEHGAVPYYQVLDAYKKFQGASTQVDAGDM